MLYEDRQKAILVEKNGKDSSSNHTSYQNPLIIITNRIISDELLVHQCPTEDMLGDFSANLC